MSNSVTIQRRRVTLLKPNITWTEAHFFDDYGSLDSIIMKSLPKNNFALFLCLLKLQITEGTENVHTILEYMHTEKTGVTIDGEYLGYDIIEYALSNYMKESDNG